MSETFKMRQIKGMTFKDFLPASISSTDEKPEFEWVEPEKLYVDEKYQRKLSKQSITLIQKIFKDFQWQRFKPPVCAWGPDNKLFVVDGQHTAIACASHPKITKIPVMVVGAHTIKERANAFIGHNRDRIKVTGTQIFHSSVAAEDPNALALKKALDNTGCVMLTGYPPGNIWVEGQTVAAATLLKLTARKGTQGVSRVLNILMGAKRAPVAASEVSAVADLIWGRDWKDKFTDYDLSTIIRAKTIDGWAAHAESTVRKGRSMASKRALAIAWFKKVPKKRSKDGKPVKDA